MPDQTHISLESIDKQLVGHVAATIRGFRVPDAYHGKGVRYAGEQLTLKEGKKVGA
jgi:large subunit ribosomal protein L6